MERLPWRIQEEAEHNWIVGIVVVVVVVAGEVVVAVVAVGIAIVLVHVVKDMSVVAVAADDETLH